MEETQAAYPMWSGGRFVPFGDPLSEDRLISLARLAYDQGIRTFITADAWGQGEADEWLGRALAGKPRESFCLVGAVGHDFYTGKRDGLKPFPRFTDPSLRRPRQYKDYLKMAVERSLARCGVSRFDLLLLQNPDFTGFSSDAVWTGLQGLKDAKMTERLGIAPGPANGFTLDLLLAFERFGSLIDWAMVILNPLEPWPGRLVLDAAQAHQVKLITRGVDHAGLFHDDVKPGHPLGSHDSRAFRPAGWIEAGVEKMEPMRAVARARGLTMLQLACLWNLAQPAVHAVAPTFIQETGGEKPIEAKIEELTRLPEVRLTSGELEQILAIGDNQGSMVLQGGNPDHTGEPRADGWPLTPDLRRVAEKWKIDIGSLSGA